jgi:putative transposase
MDEKYLIAVARYVERNPVRAGMVQKAADYQWSSARAHLTGKDDVLVKTAPLLSLVDDWEGFLAEDNSDRDRDLLRGHGRTGRQKWVHFVGPLSGVLKVNSSTGTADLGRA